MKKWIVVFTVLTGLSAALPAKADLVCSVVIGIIPPITIGGVTTPLTPVIGCVATVYATSSITGATDTYTFVMNPPPPTTPGTVALYTNDSHNSYYIPSVGIPADVEAKYGAPLDGIYSCSLLFVGGVLEDIGLFYDNGGNPHSGYKEVQLGGFTYSYVISPPIGSNGPTGPVISDNGVLSLDAPSAATPEPSTLILLTLGLAGAPARSLWRRLCQSHQHASG